MPFGAWSPLPLRLGADPQQGWSAPAQSRLSADLAAATRTVAIAELTIDTSTGAIISYNSQYGIGASWAPVFATIGAGHFGLNWAAAYQDYDETFYGWKVRAAHATVQGSAPVCVTVVLSAAFDLEIYCTNLLTSATASPIVTIEVWGDWLPSRQIGDYDGATDKADSLTEGNSSYCFDWYTELQAMRGSAYSVTIGNVDAENFAMARQFGALNRNAEKLEANSLPGTSDEKLENWLEILGLSLRDGEQRWQARQRAEAKLMAAASSALPDDVDAAIGALLGSSLTAIHRITGASLSAATPATYWPTISPGSAAYSLGGGQWSSDRCFLWVQVSQPPSAGDFDFLRLMNVDLFELLDLRLPAHMTFAWVTSDGFFLDTDLLDYGAFGV